MPLAFTMGVTSLVGEQIDRVRCMMPQQMIGPAARLAMRVHVGTTEEIGLHIHLLDIKFAGQGSLVHPLMLD
jgi:hypothetical protein